MVEITTLEMVVFLEKAKPHRPSRKLLSSVHNFKLDPLDNANQKTKNTQTNMLFKSAALALLTASAVSATLCPDDFALETCYYIKGGEEYELTDTIPADACGIKCETNYPTEIVEGFRQTRAGISLFKFSGNDKDYSDNGSFDVWESTDGGDSTTWSSPPDRCLELTCGETVYVEAIMNNGDNYGRGEVCGTREWKVECPCVAETYELSCTESVNPSGGHIPVAGDNLDPKVSPHQNPDGFYTFGIVDNCGNTNCADGADGGFAIEVFSGQGPTNDIDEKKLSKFDANPIKNLRGTDRPSGYQSCDTVKYTQFANDKKNKEQKMGSDPENVRAHLQGSGDMVIKATLPGYNEASYAICRVPKPPTNINGLKL